MLRVAVLANRLPYVLVNRERNLVGFDIEMAQLLGRDFSDAPATKSKSPATAAIGLRSNIPDYNISIIKIRTLVTWLLLIFTQDSRPILLEKILLNEG